MAIRKVVHKWDDAKGDCYDCGDPAAFVVAELYWNESERPDSPPPVDDHSIFCSVCAAQHAADGHRIFRLWLYDVDGPLTAEHERLLAELEASE